jgi:hypothetical protein
MELCLWLVRCHALSSERFLRLLERKFWYPSKWGYLKDDSAMIDLETKNDRSSEDRERTLVELRVLAQTTLQLRTLLKM